MPVVGRAQCAQHVLFIFGLDLLPRKRLAVVASGRLERDDIILPQARDCAVHGGRGSFADANVVSDLVRNARSGLEVHQAQIVPHLVVVHDLEKRRSLQLESQALAKRAVKHGVACCVREIRQDDVVLSSEFWFAVKIKVSSRKQR